MFIRGSFRERPLFHFDDKNGNFHKMFIFFKLVKKEKNLQRIGRANLSNKGLHDSDEGNLGAEPLQVLTPPTNIVRASLFFHLMKGRRILEIA
jgi:hypothetical protein